MILQTGMRTDIPAFYSEWFANRVQEGFVLVRNPYNPVLLTRYDISPDVVDMITFCTKNPSPMLDKMDILSPYGQYWFVTITPYSKEIEPGVPGWESVTDRSIRQIRSYGRTISCVLTGEIIYNDKYTIPNRTDWFI